mmetsp:Transcript_16787/g.36534  ORF Transcript_16787/g.36534 Transcript_16787/m.36534 type:complete len:87 (+) Transcript_16787:80-340(+)
MVHVLEHDLTSRCINSVQFESNQDLEIYSYNAGGACASDMALLLLCRSSNSPNCNSELRSFTSVPLVRRLASVAGGGTSFSPGTVQ